MKNESIWGIIKKIIKGLFFLPYWWSQKFIKRDPTLWIFGSWKGMRYADNSRAMFEYVISKHPEIRAYWVTRNIEVYQKLRSMDLPVVMAGTKEGNNIQKHASVVFISWGIDNDVDGRYINGCHIVFLWHGMPLKHLGYDEGVFKKRKNNLWKKIKTKFREIVLPYECLQSIAIRKGLFDTISTSTFFSPYIQSAWLLDARHVWEVGQPRNDKLFCDEKEKLITDIDSRFNRPQKVLYMPTFRDTYFYAHKVFNPFQCANFNRISFYQTLDDNNIVFLYKGHELEVGNTVMDSDRIITISDNDYDDLYTFVKDVDILITDYSSIYFDFLLCKKPIILFPFDKEDYMAHSRPFYYSYELLEGKRVFSWTELENSLKNRDYYVPSLENLSLFNECIDDKSSERVYTSVQKVLKNRKVCTANDK